MAGDWVPWMVTMVIMETDRGKERDEGQEEKEEYNQCDDEEYYYCVRGDKTGRDG